MMPAVPMKKDATSLDELVEFVRSPEVCRDTGDRPRIHLLGRGVYSPAYRETIAAVVNACPDIEVFADSVRLRSSAVLGTRAGPKAKPGPYMLAQDLYRDLGMSPYDVKRLGLELAMEQADIMERIEAHRAGWWDPEGFDSPAATFRAFTAGYGYGGAVPYADLQPYRAIDDDVDE
jgi:hypothetical protein